MKKTLLMLVAVCLLAACTPKAYTSNLEIGTAALKNGHYHEAITSFQKAYQKKKTEEVEELLDLAQYMDQSEIALQKGQFLAAEKLLHKVLNMKSNQAIVKNIKVKAKKKLADAKKMAAVYKKLKDQNEAGKKQFEQNQFDEAYDTFKSVSETKSYTDNHAIKGLKDEGTRLLIQTTDAKKKYEEEQAKEAALMKEEEAKKKQEDAAKALTKEEAEDLVRKHLEIGDDQNVFVKYDHEQNGAFIIHVYEFLIDDPKTKQGHTQTWGWYGVNKTTKEIFDAMNP